MAKSKGYLKLVKRSALFVVLSFSLYAIIFSQRGFGDVGSVVRFESFRAQKLSRFEDFRALKLSEYESFRALKPTRFESFKAIKLSNLESLRALK